MVCPSTYHNYINPNTRRGQAADAPVCTACFQPRDNVDVMATLIDGAMVTATAVDGVSETQRRLMGDSNGNATAMVNATVTQWQGQRNGNGNGQHNGNATAT